MSGQCTGWVMRHGPHPNLIDRVGVPYGPARARAMRAVLLTIADAANRDGDHAHPGMEAMIDGSLYARRQVQRVVAELMDERWIELEAEGGGRGRATVYRVPMEVRHHGTLSGDETAPSDEVNRAISVPETAPFSTETAPLPLDLAGSSRAPTVYTTEVLNGRDTTACADGFAAFYALYPRKIDPKKAQARYALAIKNGATHDEVMAGLHRWIGYWQADRTAEAVIKHPDSWLHNERWKACPPRAKPSNGMHANTVERDAHMRETMQTGRILNP